MIWIDGNTIKMTRGDTARLTVTIYNRDGTVYHPAIGDSVRFTVKRRVDDPYPVIRKSVPIDTMVLCIDPADTRRLECGAVRGRYHYDIDIVMADGTVDTFIPWADFILTEEAD